MSTNDFKIKYLKDLKAKTEKKLNALTKKIEANPLGEIFELHKQSIEIIKRNGKSEEFVPLIAKEKKLKKLFDWQQHNYIAAIEEQVKLENVISDINNEIFIINIRLNRGI